MNFSKKIIVGLVLAFLCLTLLAQEKRQHSKPFYHSYLCKRSKKDDSKLSCRLFIRGDREDLGFHIEHKQLNLAAVKEYNLSDEEKKEYEDLFRPDQKVDQYLLDLEKYGPRDIPSSLTDHESFHLSYYQGFYEQSEIERELALTFAYETPHLSINYFGHFQRDENDPAVQKSEFYDIDIAFKDPVNFLSSYGQDGLKYGHKTTIDSILGVERRHSFNAGYFANFSLGRRKSPSLEFDIETGLQASHLQASQSQYDGESMQVYGKSKIRMPISLPIVKKTIFADTYARFESDFWNGHGFGESQTLSYGVGIDYNITRVGNMLLNSRIQYDYRSSQFGEDHQVLLMFSFKGTR